MTEVDWTQHLGKRLLVCKSSITESRPILEVRVTEVSPKGRPRLKHDTGRWEWAYVNEFTILEELSDSPTQKSTQQ